MTTAADQLRRLLTLIPRLADGDAHPVADVATIVGVSAEQLIDDLASLVNRFDLPGGFVEGVQVWYDGDTVSAVTPHFLRPMRLTMAELCALELGLAIVRSERAEADQAAIDRALARLRAIISEVPGDEAKQGLVTGSTSAAGVEPRHLAQLRRAIQHRRKSRILYRRASAAESEARMICPYSLVFVSGMWYVVAHCEKAEALRVFRLDRVSDVTGEDSTYEVPGDYSVERVLESAKALMPADDAETVRIRYAPSIARWIAEREGRELGADGSVVIEHRLLDDDWAVRHALQYGAEAEVQAPDRIREALREALRPR